MRSLLLWEGDHDAVGDAHVDDLVADGSLEAPAQHLELLLTTGGCDAGALRPDLDLGRSDGADHTIAELRDHP